MRRHRTTARGILFLLAAAGVAAGSAVAATPAGSANAAVPRLIFPVVGPSTYGNDYGDARGQGRHEGIDIVAPKRALAVAAEAGTVRFWTTSARAGCMLYLEGRSGTTYLYIHLNNDLTRGNDNRGKCVPGVAYAPGLTNGARVRAGEPVGYVGDSGDADGITSHLHFEVRPGGRVVNPFPHLNRAQRLLFAGRPGSTFRLTLRGKVVEAEGGALALRVAELRRFPGGLHVPRVNRTVKLEVPPDVVVFNPVGAIIAQAQARLAQARGEPATVWTKAGQTTLPAQLGVPNVLAAERVALLGDPALGPG